MTDKDKNVLANIQSEIDKINNKESKVFFFVIDTKGVPSGSLAYIYHLAKFVKDEGYNVTMLHTEEEFEGVGGWLGEEFAELEHVNVNGNEVETKPSDVLFIPEIYAQVMNQTKELPCKRVAILQNFNYLVEQTPFSAQWGDFKIFDAIANSEYEKNLLASVFPYVKAKVVTPFVSKIFGETVGPKNLVVNIVSRNQEDVNKVVKPFYWKYPLFKFVTFRDLRTMPQKEVAAAMRESSITVWIDEESSFGYAALEAMKSGSLVIAKVPTTETPWEFKEGKELSNSCIWFTDYDTLHKQLASVIRAVMTDKVPSEIGEAAKKTVAEYTEERTKKEFMDAFNEIISKRKKEMEELIIQIKATNNE